MRSIKVYATRISRSVGWSSWSIFTATRTSRSSPPSRRNWRYGDDFEVANRPAAGVITRRPEEPYTTSVRTVLWEPGRVTAPATRGHRDGGHDGAKIIEAIVLEPIDSLVAGSVVSAQSYSAADDAGFELRDYRVAGRCGRQRCTVRRLLAWRGDAPSLATGLSRCREAVAQTNAVGIRAQGLELVTRQDRSSEPVTLTRDRFAVPRRR